MNVKPRVSRYRGTDGATPAKPKKFVEPTDENPACPVCGAGVRIAKALHSDTRLGVKKDEPVYGSHREGGGRAQYGVTCAGFGMPYIGD